VYTNLVHKYKARWMSALNYVIVFDLLLNLACYFPQIGVVKFSKIPFWLLSKEHNF